MSGEAGRSNCPLILVLGPGGRQRCTARINAWGLAARTRIVAQQSIMWESMCLMEMRRRGLVMSTQGRSRSQQEFWSLPLPLLLPYPFSLPIPLFLCRRQDVLHVSYFLPAWRKAVPFSHARCSFANKVTAHSLLDNAQTPKQERRAPRTARKIP